jgi:large subunit ribosomal protein L22
MKALLTNFHQSPQKVRLVANLVRGKSVAVARQTLTYQPQKSSEAVLKLLNSAVANASNNNSVSADDLFIMTIEVNKGAVLKRFAPRARGRAAKFSKTMSIISLELGITGAPKMGKVAKTKAVKEEATDTEAPKTVKKTTKKRAAKKVATK